LLGFTFIFGFGEKIAIKGTGKAIKLTSETVIDMAKMIKDVKPVRQSILNGEPVRLDIFTDTVGTWISRAIKTKPNSELVRPPAWLEKKGILPEIEDWRYTTEPFPKSGALPVPQSSSAVELFNRDIKPVIQTGRGVLISRGDVLSPAAKNVKKALQAFQARTGRTLHIDTTSLDRLVQNGTAYVVPDEVTRRLGGAGFARGDMIVISNTRYNELRGLGTVHHEMTHVATGYRQGYGWSYGSATKKDKIFTAIYELMTDAWADLSMGQDIMSEGSHIATGSYAAKNPQIVDTMFHRLFNGNPELLDDFLQFAIDGDSDRLVNKVAGGSYEEFLNMFEKKGINLNAISYAGGTAALGEVAANGNNNEPLFVEPAIEIGDGFIQNVAIDNPAYQAIIDCFNKKVADDPSCKDSDLNNDGVIDGKDYNLYLRDHPTSSP